MKTVIMAGGKGTRIHSIAEDCPKPMIKVEGVPVLEREIRCLRSQGFSSFIITVSHMADKIMEYFGDGRKFDVDIQYFKEEIPLGNAGALFKIKEQLTETFLLLNADVLFDVDFNRFVDYHRKKGGLATLFTHPNSHPFDSSVLVTDGDGSVKRWLTKEDPRPQWYANRVNSGLHILSPAVLKLSGIDADSVGAVKDGKRLKVDLDRQLLKPLCGTGKMFCYDSPEYVKDMGTPERYRAVCEDVAAGRVQAKNLRNKQKAVFLDRDGVINRYVGFLRDIDEFKLLPDAAEAIKMINHSGCLAIVVTNQPVVARGEVSVAELQAIHNKMETLLGQQGAYVDAIYYCPHHPDKGFPGEIPELKTTCSCRKPRPGMLLQAAADLHIDLEASWMVGDADADVSAGMAAGCRAVKIGTNASLLPVVKKIIGEAP